jgi:hypothetical protein
MPRGEVLSLQQAWQLSVAWYHDRSDANWRRKTPEEAHAVFAQIGLTSEFWRL